MMKYISRLFFLLCLPGILWCYPAETTPTQSSSILTFAPWDFLNTERLSCDRIFDFTEMIENTENLEEMFSENELTAIEDFFIYLARNGIRDWDVDAQEELEENIAWLVESDNTSWFFPNRGEDSFPIWITPFFDFNKLKLSSASLIPTCKPHITLCKSKSKKPFQKIKQFIKKHKKAIIIGAVVVVAIVIITVATQGSGTAPALAAGAARVAGADDANDRRPIHKPGEVNCRENEIEQGSDQHRVPLSDTPCSMPSPSVHPEVAKVIDQKSAEIKETLSFTLPELDPISNQEQTQIGKEVRQVANHTVSDLTHQAVDAVADFLRVGPEFCEAMEEIGERAFPDLVSFPKFPGAEDKLSPTQQHDQAVVNVHEAIDRCFGTEQASLYTPEAKALKDEKTAIGVLPPPGSLRNPPKNNPKPLSSPKTCPSKNLTIVNAGKTTSISLEELVRSGNIIDKGELTKAGRSLQKKTDRVGSAFEKPRGTPAEVNLQGQKVLEEILNHPANRVIVRNDATARMGHEVLEVRIPDGRGVRFTKNGNEMICFLEP